MKNCALWIITSTVFFTGCYERHCSQKDAITRAISFNADKRTIKATFAKLPSMSAFEGQKMLIHTLGTDNLSGFLLTQTSDVTNCFSVFIDPTSIVAVSRCATAGKSLVTYSDLSHIKVTKVSGEWMGSFAFNVENCYTGICHFSMIETKKGFLVTKLYFPRLVNDDATSNLVVYAIENVEHLRMTRDRRYFKEMEPNSFE